MLLTNQVKGTSTVANYLNPVLFISGLLLLLFIFLLPRVVLGENSFVTIHDNLDSSFVWYIHLSRYGKLLTDDAVIENVMNGISAKLFPSNLNVTVWFFYLLSPFKAYVANEMLVRAFAYIGMFLLLQKHLMRQHFHTLWIVGIAFTFAAIPLYSLFGLAVAGQPLLLYAFLNLKKNEHNIVDYLIIIVFAFYSSLALVGFFILVVLTIWLILQLLKERNLPVPFLTGMVVLVVAYVVAEHNLFMSMLFSTGFTSHRVSFNADYQAVLDIREVVQVAADNFVFGYYHVATVHRPIILSAIIALIACWQKKDFRRYGNLMLLFIIALIFSCWYSVYNSYLLTGAKNAVLLLKTFNFSRFIWLHPIIWYLIFSLSIAGITRHIRWGAVIAGCLLLLQLAFNLKSTTEVTNEFYMNALLLHNEFQGSNTTDKATSGIVTFKEYYSEDLFHKIKEHIARPQHDYRVACIGIQPGIAQYNGFYTLDGYQHNYPLEYKKRFRTIIEDELSKSDKWRAYYDGWGSRFYIFASELEEYDIKKSKKKEINNLSLNTEAFKSLGGEYIFSAVRINNAEKNNLALERIFESEDSPWRIFLYRVI